MSVSLLSTRFQTPVSKKNTNPTYDAKDATFDFPIHLSLADKLGVVELVVWDKDMLTKDYLGEVAIPLEDWFNDNNAFGFDGANNKVSLHIPFAHPHHSSPWVSHARLTSYRRERPSMRLVPYRSSLDLCQRPTRNR